MREASRKRRAAKIGEQLKNGEIRPEEAQEGLSKLSEPQRGWLDILDSTTVTSDELASLKLAPRQPLLGEWLCEGDYGIIYAPRGTGKTFFALLIAKAVSAGGHVGELQAPGCAKVLYIDGEMPADLMRNRDSGLGKGNVEFLNHEILFDRKEKVLNITNPQLQHAILGRCIRNGIKLVVLDNLSTLASGVKENDSYDWEQLHNWLLQFRRHRIAVILVIMPGVTANHVARPNARTQRFGLSLSTTLRSKLTTSGERISFRALPNRVGTHRRKFRLTNGISSPTRRRAKSALPAKPPIQWTCFASGLRRE
jgi:AAA domain